jgi:hypothetical protein
MAKYCVFCGDPPTEKNKEHVLPKWLIELTGNPNRKVRLGFRFGTESPTDFREFAFDQFTFPACEACNLEHSKLEAHAKELMLRVLASDSLEPSEISALLDWFDKVRVGLWLGFHQLNKNFFDVEPNFHIARRIGQFDRALFIQRSDFVGTRLSFGGTDTPAFSYVPSVFTLIVNNIYFTNISSAFLLARRLGFPYPRDMYLLPDREEIFCELQPGRKRIMRPVLQHTLPSQSVAIFQPMYGPNLVTERSSLYDEQYVRDHSIQPLHGVGSVFVGTPDGGGRALEPRESFPFVSPVAHPDRRLFIESAIDVCSWQNWLTDGKLNLDRLLPQQRQLVRSKQRFAMRFNDMLTKHHNRILREEFNGAPM